MIVEGILCMREVGWAGGGVEGRVSELSAPSSVCDEGRGPSHSSLCLAFFPPGMTAEGVAALRRPALGRQWRETNLTHRRL